MPSPAEDRIVCRCFVVGEAAIRRAIQDHDLRQVEEVTAATKAGGGCSSCWDEIQDVLSGIHGTPAPRDAADDSGLTAPQKRARIVELLEREIDVLFGWNGLSMQLVEVTADRVLARFQGPAVGTTSASYLALKKEFVRLASDACGRRMTLVELNVLEELQKSAKP